MTQLQEELLKQHFLRYKNSTREELEEEIRKKHSDVILFLYDLKMEESHLKQILNLTDEEFQSEEGQNQVLKYYEDNNNANEFLFNQSEEEIEELLNREFIGEQELINSIEEYGQFGNYTNQEDIYYSIEHLIKEFIGLPNDYKKMFHETVKYVIEFNKEDKYDYDTDKSYILEGQEQHNKLLQDIQKQMLEMTESLLNQNNKISSTEQEMIESSSILTMTQLSKKIKRSDDTIREWCNQYNNNMPHIRNGSRGQYRFVWEKVKKWGSDNGKF